MNCFYHPESPAIGLCKSCLRGLCAECAADIHNGLACRNQCEDRARTINRMVDANPTVMATANTQLRRNMLFTLVAGVLFIVLGLTMGFEDTWLPGGIFAALGVAFIVRGITSYTRAARYPTPDKEPGR